MFQLPTRQIPLEIKRLEEHISVRLGIQTSATTRGSVYEDAAQQMAGLSINKSLSWIGD